MLLYMYQIFSSLRGHFHFFVHFFFTFMEHFFLDTPYNWNDRHNEQNRSESQQMKDGDERDGQKKSEKQTCWYRQTVRMKEAQMGKKYSETDRKKERRSSERLGAIKECISLVKTLSGSQFLVVQWVLVLLLGRWLLTWASFAISFPKGCLTACQARNTKWMAKVV